MSVQTITSQTLQDWLSHNSARLVDVREAVEFQNEHIVGAVNQPLSSFEADRLPQDSRIVFYCASGMRQRTAADRSAAVGHSVYVLEGGIEGWKASGLETVKAPKQRLEIMRQVQIIAGSLVLLGVILGVTVDQMWLLLAGVPGAGLLFAGLSGFCGLALVLGRMPWNQVRDASQAPQPAA